MLKKENNNVSVLGKRNYILLSIGFILVVIGYILMSGGKSPDPKIFSEELFTTTRITVAPVLVLLGFAIDVFALVLKPKEE
ncbi:MAG: hypothetical protein COX07_08325 [Bacteroidetes bacterium CG23_combo_of_CG06-09_8_20_14_all_32_9]|nr:MAG: hypothetical protein COX07_08325 [Bacteroidetes bacterium CG23_combo_of_CG06-09_8_20_14_all_32_9]